MSRIMLVEDDPMIAEIYRKKFEIAGFEVVNAVNGKEVLKMASEDHFDIILLDMVLPEMSGMDVLKELKQSGKYPEDIKVFVFSNLSKAEHENEARKNGADGYISKTEFSPSQLVDEIKRILNEFSEQEKNKQRLSNGKTDVNCEGKKILFIEDEEIFLEMFGNKLEAEGYCLTYAKNGAWGIKEALEHDYDMIITDMVMPAVGGEEIVRRLKAEDNKKDIPIIVISASLVDEDIQPVRDMGITDFYEKTKLIPSDLARRVKELLS
jgi:two-component system sensor histidine kinase/response regulator